MRGVAVAAFLASLSIVMARAQEPHAERKAENSSAAASRPTITFAIEWGSPGVPVPKYKLVIHDDGTGSYAGEASPPPTRYGPAASSAAVPFQRELRLTAATAARIFELAAQMDHFNRACASKAKNIADTGTKMLTYSGPDGAGTCTYNYTEIKELATLTELIQGITETLDEGRQLDRLHRYDRLGLDSAIAHLQEEAAAGRALELQTIGDSLRAIIADPELLARVRGKADAMLKQTAAAEREMAR